MKLPCKTSRTRLLYFQEIRRTQKQDQNQTFFFFLQSDVGLVTLRKKNKKNTSWHVVCFIKFNLGNCASESHGVVPHMHPKSGAEDRVVLLLNTSLHKLFFRCALWSVDIDGILKSSAAGIKFLYFIEVLLTYDHLKVPLLCFNPSSVQDFDCTIIATTWFFIFCTDRYTEKIMVNLITPKFPKSRGMMVQIPWESHLITDYSLKMWRLLFWLFDFKNWIKKLFQPPPSQHINHDLSKSTITEPLPYNCMNLTFWK